MRPRSQVSRKAEKSGDKVRSQLYHLHHVHDFDDKFSRIAGGIFTKGNFGGKNWLMPTCGYDEAGNFLLINPLWNFSVSL